MQATIVGQRRKISKLHWIKRPKTVPPKNEIWAKKQKKRSLMLQYLFIILIDPHSFYEPQLTQYCKKYSPATQPKTLLYKFSCKHASGWCQKKYLHCTISRRPETAFSKGLENKCLYIPVNFRKKISVPETQKPFIWCGLNNFLKAVYYLGLVKSFKIFYLIEVFGNSIIFQHFDTSSITLKC